MTPPGEKEETSTLGTEAGDSSPSKTTAIWVGIAGGAFALAFMLRILASGSGDPTVFLIVGEEATEIAAHVETLLGRPIVLAPSVGHDGRFFFIQAMDPWITEPELYEDLLDRPRHRAVRPLYPMLSSAFGVLRPIHVLWTMAAINVLAMAAGTFVTARVAQHLSLTAWLGLSFSLNPGMLFEQQIAGAGVLAWALGIGAVRAIQTNHNWLAGVLLAAATLTREPMLLTVAGLAMWGIGARRQAVVPLVLPTVVLGSAWFAWVIVRVSPIGDPFGQSLGLPFVGLVRAMPGWLSVDQLGFGFAVVILLLGALIVVAAVQDRDPLSWATAGFALLAPFLSQLVWQQSFDSSRAVAPLFTSAAVLLLARIRRRKRAGLLHPEMMPVV